MNIQEHEQKNWRGEPVHPVDEWDHWKMKLEEYEDIRLVYDLLVLAGTDMVLVHKMIEHVGRFYRLEEADHAAGESI